MPRSPLLAVVLLLGFASVAFAADITGRWVGKVSTPNGELELVYDFAVEGETLTGALSSQFGEIPLSDGKISGDNLSFTMTFGDNPVAYTGLVKGDTIVLTSEWGGEARELVLTRAVTQ
jgi:hypothetical protein